MKDSLLASLPDFAMDELQLGNGFRVIAIEKPGSNVIAMQFRFHGGPLYEEKGMEGITHFLEHVMLASGTTKSPTRKARDREASGILARYNYWTGTDHLGMWMLGESSSARDMLVFARDGLFSPILPQRQVNEEKPVVLQEINKCTSDPEIHSMYKLRAQVWFGHPISRPIWGTEASLDSLKRRDIVEHHRRFISPDRGTLFLVGGIKPDNLLRQADEIFASVAITADSDLITPLSPLGIRSGIQVVENAGLPNTHIRMGIDTQGLTRSSLALSLFLEVLRNRNFYSFAGGDRNKIAYTAHTDTWFEKDYGLLIPYIVTDPEHVPRVVEQVAQNMAKRVTANELEVVRQEWALDYLLCQEAVWEILPVIINDDYHLGRIRNYSELARELKEIGLAEVEAVRSKLNKPESFAVLTYGQAPGETSLAAWN